MGINVKKSYGQGLTDDQAMAIIERDTAQPKSRAEYRVAATRSLTGGKKVGVAPDNSSLTTVGKLEGTYDDVDAHKKNQSIIEFQSSKFAVLESCEKMFVIVERSGDTTKLVTVDYKTRDGTANAGTDFKQAEGTLRFQPNETEQKIGIEIIDDTAYELDEDFYVDLFNPCAPDEKEAKDSKAVLGGRTVATVTIIDDDEPGTLFFDKESDTITEMAEDQTCLIQVNRKNGSKGVVSCKYYTENESAISPSDYEHTEGTVKFKNGQMSANIEVCVKARGRYDGTEMFRLILEEPAGGAKFDKNTDGGDDQCIMSIFIQADAGTKTSVDAMTSLLKMNWDKVRVGSSNYADQFTAAFYVNGSSEDQAEAGLSDWFTHVLSLPWKLFFAVVPPPDYADGWVCFNVALVFIGFVTMIIGDMAALLGCCMGVPDAITAITFVALGTSLPDTFASKTAATQDPYADASIGNVTGSNSVNVFLGLGLPWLMGAVFWTMSGQTKEWVKKYPELATKYPDGGFAVPAGDLGFSVIIFSTLACMTVLTFVIRRKAVGGELGGPKGSKYASAVMLVLFWLVYVAASAWKTLDSMKKEK